MNEVFRENGVVQKKNERWTNEMKKPFVFCYLTNDLLEKILKNDFTEKGRKRSK